MSATRSRRRRGWRSGLGHLLLLLSACSRTPYPAPQPRVIAPLQAPPELAGDPGDAAGIAALEQACRTRLQGVTMDASLAAIDRVRELLGQSCELQTVGGDPLHWWLRCHADALFESGSYALGQRRVRCAERRGPQSPWTCMGAAVQRLLREGSIAGLGVAVLGHADLQPLGAPSEAHLCTELQAALGYTPEPPWRPLPADAPDEARIYANHQLAFCRAASVTQALLSGLEPPASRVDGATGTRLDVAALGMGTAWLRAQPGARCPGPVAGGNDRGVCAEARRVDLLLRFTPAAEGNGDGPGCPDTSAAGRLACLQECLERAAIRTRPAVQTTAVDAPLFVDVNQLTPTRPPGFYLAGAATASPPRVLDVTRVCRTLGIDDGICP